MASILSRAQWVNILDIVLNIEIRNSKYWASVTKNWQAKSPMHNSMVVYNGSELFCTAQLYDITIKVAQIAMTTM